MGDERHRRDPGGKTLAPDFDFQFGALRGVRAGDVGHRDRMAERWREAAAGDAADFLVAEIDQRALARGQAAFERETDALRVGPVFDQTEDALGARKAAVGAATLADREAEAGGDRVGVGRKILPVERQPRLQPQRIARAEADRLDLDLGAEATGDRLRVLGRNRELEPVLASITRAADADLDLAEAERGALPELDTAQRRP